MTHSYFVTGLVVIDDEHIMLMMWDYQHNQQQHWEKVFSLATTTDDSGFGHTEELVLLLLQV